MWSNTHLSSLLRDRLRTRTHRIWIDLYPSQQSWATWPRCWDGRSVYPALDRNRQSMIKYCCDCRWCAIGQGNQIGWSVYCTLHLLPVSTSTLKCAIWNYRRYRWLLWCSRRARLSEVHQDWPLLLSGCRMELLSVHLLSGYQIRIKTWRRFMGNLSAQTAFSGTYLVSFLCVALGE